MPLCSVTDCNHRQDVLTGWAACHHCGALLCPRHAAGEATLLKSDPAFPGEVPAHHCRPCREKHHAAKAAEGR